MIEAALSDSLAASWPAQHQQSVGKILVNHSPEGGGRRVNAARVLAGWQDDDLDGAIARMRANGQRPLVQCDHDDARLRTALAARGFAEATPTRIMLAELNDLPTTRPPPITAFTIWPPLAIQNEIWDESGIDPARRAIMARAMGPKTALLGRVKDRAAGVGFVACHQGDAVLHALAVLSDWRRLGLAQAMLQEAAHWARQAGATRLALAVEAGNGAACALYEQFGLRPVGGYLYAQGPATV